VPRPDALAFQRFVPAFDLPVRLRVKRRRSHVRHARDPNELFKILGNKPWAVVGNDPPPRFRLLLFGSLHDDLDVGLRHLLPQIPVDNVAAEAVQDSAQVIKRYR
jgi:hypothetical protein